MKKISTNIIVLSIMNSLIIAVMNEIISSTMCKFYSNYYKIYTSML